LVDDDNDEEDLDLMMDQAFGDAFGVAAPAAVAVADHAAEEASAAGQVLAQESHLATESIPVNADDVLFEADAEAVDGTLVGDDDLLAVEEVEDVVSEEDVAVTDEGLGEQEPSRSVKTAPEQVEGRPAAVPPVGPTPVPWDASSAELSLPEWSSPGDGGYADATPLETTRSSSMAPAHAPLLAAEGAAAGSWASSPSNMNMPPSLVPALRAATRTRRHVALVTVVLIPVIAALVWAFRQPGPESASAATVPRHEPAARGDDVAAVVTPMSEAEASDEQGSIIDFSIGNFTSLRRRRPALTALDQADGEGGGSLRGGTTGAKAASFGGLVTKRRRRDDRRSGEVRERGPSGSSSSRARRGGRSLSADSVRTTIARNHSSIRRCHEREMRRTAAPVDANVVVNITVGSTGAVVRATLRDAAMAATPLGSCIVQAVRGWNFPESSGSTQIETPFNLVSRSVGSSAR
jgi:hypothetical protein